MLHAIRRWQARSGDSRFVSKGTLAALFAVLWVLVGSLAFSAERPPPHALVLTSRLPAAMPHGLSFRVPAPVTLVDPAPTLVPELADEAFTRALGEDVTELGALSIGAANRGLLFNGVPMPESPRWVIAEPRFSFGTEETVQAIAHAIDAVNELYPNTHPLTIGHLSKATGGWLRPHHSHQSGRDVDLGLYYTDDSRWYVKATAENFDVERNWALLSALMKTTPVEYIFIDRSLHPALKSQALAVGEAPNFVRDAFDGIPGVTQPLIRHARGHDDHVHVRFQSHVAVQAALRARNLLGKRAFRRGRLLSMLQVRAKKQHKN